MNILLVDDEPLALSRLGRLAKELGYTALLQASCAKEALALLETHAVDLLITDIHMPELSGLELAYAFRVRAPRLPIIFQSAYEEHALAAFDIGAADYLLKPYTSEQLQRAISRATPQALRLLTKNRDTFYLLEPQEIFYIKADLAEVMVRSKEGFSYYANKISHMEALLNPHGFVRIHRSCLLNLGLVSHFESVEQSRLRFFFKGLDEVVESSKEGAKLFRQRFKEA